MRQISTISAPSAASKKSTFLANLVLHSMQAALASEIQ